MEIGDRENVPTENRKKNRLSIGILNAILMRDNVKPLKIIGLTNTLGFRVAVEVEDETVGLSPLGGCRQLTNSNLFERGARERGNGC